MDGPSDQPSDEPDRTCAPARSDPRRSDTRHARPAGWAIGALGAVFALLVPLALLALPVSEIVAVVGRPGDGAADVAGRIARAGGSMLNAGGSDAVIVARADRPGFATRLYAAGAGLVLDARSAAWCDRSNPASVASNPTGSIPR